MKQWYTSKLIWVGLITLSYGIAKLLGANVELSSGSVETILGALVILLRAVTGKQITFNKDAEL